MPTATVRAERLARSEPQYVDLVAYVTAHANQLVSAHDYVEWSGRDLSIDWDPTSVETLERRVNSKLAQLTVVDSLPQRPHTPSPSRNAGWLAALHSLGGAFYRTGHGKSGLYVLDLQAKWLKASSRNKVVLRHHQWSHNPVATVRRFMPAPALPSDIAALPDPEVDPDPMPEAPRLGFDPTPDVLTAAAEAAAVPVDVDVKVDEGKPAARFNIVGLDPKVGGTVVLAAEGLDDNGAPVAGYITALVTAIVPEVP